MIVIQFIRYVEDEDWMIKENNLNIYLAYLYYSVLNMFINLNISNTHTQVCQIIHTNLK